MLAALEFACLDILGQAWGVPVSEILGGRLRDRVPFASYCFFRYRRPGEVRTIDQVVENARDLKRRYGFTTHKVKAGVFHPDYELECYRARGGGVPGRFVPLRLQCRVVHRAGDPLRAGDRRDSQRLPGGSGVRPERMRRVRQMVRVPLATNTVVVNFEQLAANMLDTAVDVILLDTTFWGGIRAVRQGGGRLRDVPARRGRALLGRAGDSARDDAAHGRGDSESVLCRRRALSSPDGRHHRRRADAVRERRRSRCRTVRVSA